MSPATAGSTRIALQAIEGRNQPNFYQLKRCSSNFLALFIDFAQHQQRWRLVLSDDNSENSPKIVHDLSEDIKLSLETTSAMLSALAWILKG